MKLAYVTNYDASDIHAWSGSGNYILRALKDAGFETDSIGNLKESKIEQMLSRLKKAYYTKLISKAYLRDREPAILMDYSSQVNELLASIDYEVVFSPGTTSIAYLQTEKPIVFWTDATFAGMIDFYPEFANLCAETVKNGNKIDQSVLSKCHLAIYSSEWAANTAIQNYDVDPRKVKVVPFGANISCDRTLNDIDRIVENKSFDSCKLLFLGVDWYRKGGEKALAVASILNKRGVRTELNVVGCTPPIILPSFVKCYGFISKKTEDGVELLERLMTETHFLILPAKAECFGLVFAEASSFGLPSLATKVGGICTVIQDGKNGYTFSPDETPEKYCDYVERFMSSKQEYRKLALSSFQEYSERLNWLSAGRQIFNLVKQFCS